MKEILICLFLVMISSVSALQFSPTSLDFEMKQGQTVCQQVYVETDSAASVNDSWAESINSDWRISLFNSNSEDVGIVTSYPKKIGAGRKEIGICLTGNEIGGRKGALVFKQEKIGNSLIQFAIWMKVNVVENDDGYSNSDSSTSSDGSSKSSGSSRNSIVYDNQNYDLINSKNKINYFDSDVEGKNEPIVLNSPRRKAAGVEKNLFFPMVLIEITCLIFILFIFVTMRKIYK